MTGLCAVCILLVDDDERLRPRLARAFETRGHRTIQASTVHDALEPLAGTPTHAVIDLKMPDGSGLDLIRPLLDRYPELRIVVLTGYGSIGTAVDAVRLGAVDYITKPADADRILAAFAPTSAAAHALADDPNYQPPSLARAEWEHIQRVLDDCGGNITLASKKLGLHRRTLQRKLNTYPPKT